MKKINIIVPCYNEEKCIQKFYDEIKKIKCKYKIEVMFIDDGSTDKTLNIIKKLAKANRMIKYLSFSRNFGKEAAMLSGLEHVNGDYIVIMDVDLQDPPSLIPEMVKYIEKDNYDIVATRRVTRKGEPIIRSFFAKLFYKIIIKTSKVEIVDGARDYRMMTRQVVDNILKLKEYNRFSKGIFSFVGFNTKWIEYENQERYNGKTKWSFWKLFHYAILGITSFTTLPLTIIAFIGLLFCIISLIMIIFVIVRTLINGDPTSGWPSLVCIIFFVSGIQLLCVGIIGEYLAKMYMEVKNRPIYIVKESNIYQKQR